MRLVIRQTKNDTGPTLTVQIWDENTDLPIDVSASTSVVTLKYRKKGTTTILQTLTGSKTEPTAGIVQFQFAALAYDVGTYEAEITVLKGGITQTVEDIITFPLRAEFA